MNPQVTGTKMIHVNYQCVLDAITECKLKTILKRCH